MRIKHKSVIAVTVLIAVLTAASTYLRADTGSCGGASITLPFTDVPSSNTFFCAIAEAYFSALSNGTSATTYSPSANVPREQMAAFVTRTLDQSLKRGNLRAALNQWATPTSVPSSASGATTLIGATPELAQSDGADIWVANDSGTVSRVRASDGKLLDTWTGAAGAFGVLVARGRIFITGDIGAAPGKLYRINPRDAAGAVSTVSSTLGQEPHGLTTDGFYIWTANFDGSVSKVDPDTGATSTFTTGFSPSLGILYDGANVWVADRDAGKLLKLNSSGDIIQFVNVGSSPYFPVFDGTNIWVPNIGSNSVTVVRVKDAQGNPLSTPFVLATLTDNGLNGPVAAAFDGQRILVTNLLGDSVSLWKASDLIPLGSFNAVAGSSPIGACSDGINFWIVLRDFNMLARF